MTRLWTFLGLITLVGVLATPAQAAPLANPEWIIGSEIVAVVSTGTAFIDELFLDAPLDNSLGTILNNVMKSGESPLDVVDVAEAFDAPQWNATGLDATAAGGGPAIQADVVDEPSSLLMFGFGLVALVFVMKRQGARRP